MKQFYLLFTLLFISITIHSQVFVKHDATGNNDGTSWGNAYPNLQDALDNANANDQIWITAGTYKPMNNALSTDNWFAVNQPVEIYGGFTGTETMLSERDWENNITTLSADILGDDVEDDFENFRSDNAAHIFVINEDGSTLDGLTITGGNSRTDGQPIGTTNYTPWNGGGVVTYHSLEIRNCTFSQCVAYYGAAFFSRTNDAGENEIILDNCIFEKNSGVQSSVGVVLMNSATIKDCIIRDNQASDFSGGLLIALSNATVEDCIFQNNETLNSIGGGVFIFQNSFGTIANPLIEFRRCSFLNNNAFAGGGLCFNNFYEGSQLILDSCDFIQNTNSLDNQGGGGGLLIQNLEDTFGGQLSSLSAEITNCRFEANSALDGGGAYLYSNFDTMNITIQNTEFEENTAGSGGGGFYMENYQSFINATIQNSEFTNNESGFGGGAIGMINNNDDTRLNYDIVDCTFIANRSGYCGAIWSSIYNFGDSGAIGSISNSTFLENEGTQCCGAFGSLGEDLIIDNTLFDGNTTEALDTDTPGGGGAFFRLPKNITVRNTIFTNNTSSFHGAALMVQEGDRVQLENVLIAENIGSISTIYNEDSLWMTNVTMADNESGIFQGVDGYLELQNNILANIGGNYDAIGNATIVSNGGNLSNDTSLQTQLIGMNGFNDFNNIDPLLGIDFMLEQNSPGIDAGNPTNVQLATDLAGMDRIQGNQIDIGAFESPFTVDVEDFEKLGIDVYPNPFVDQIQLSDLEGIKGIQLINVEGKLVQIFSIQQELIVQKDLPVGVYFLELNYGDKKYYAKLEKQH